jgi:hypothetical protein
VHSAALPVPRSLYPIGREGLFSPPEGLSAALLLFRLTKGGYAWSVARGIIHSSETAWNARTNSVRVCSNPPRPLSPASLQRGRDVCAWLPLHAHTRAFTHTPSREPAVRVCALRVFRCVSFCLQRFQQRERCSRVRRLLWRVALLAAGQPDLVRPTFDDGRVRLMHALAAFMRWFHRSSSDSFPRYSVPLAHLAHTRAVPFGGTTI